MFDIDIKGLAEINGGRSPLRLACEPIANAFDEARGYGGKPLETRPTRVEVTTDLCNNPRGVALSVSDDGPGFADIRDAYTLFGTTAKRSDPTVAGRFNAGDKQLVAVARSATIVSGGKRVRFENGKRTVGNLSGPTTGVHVFAIMPWTMAQLRELRESLGRIIPPVGLLMFTVDGVQIERPVTKWSGFVTLPTVTLIDGVMKTTQRRTRVDVFPTNGKAGWLYELGIPVCELADFPWLIDVGQKIPLDLSRDMVTPAYQAQVIGKTIEGAAMDGRDLLTPEQVGAGFVRDALDWVRQPEALTKAVGNLFGEHAVRQSSDPIANQLAMADGATIIPGRLLSEETRKRLPDAVLPTASQRYGGAAEAVRQQANDPAPRCPVCGR